MTEIRLSEEEYRRQRNRKRSERRKRQKKNEFEEREQKRLDRQQRNLERMKLEASKLPPPTEHCLMRWGERFRPDECFYTCYVKSMAVSWESLLAVARTNGLTFRLSSACTYRYHPPTGAVFVIGQDGTCRTVVRYKGML